MSKIFNQLEEAEQGELALRFRLCEFMRSMILRNQVRKASGEVAEISKGIGYLEAVQELQGFLDQDLTKKDR